MTQNSKNRMTESNKILTPWNYGAVANQGKRLKSPQVVRPQIHAHERMFKDVEPSKPVSELERVMNELLKFMKDHFSQSGNSIGNPLDCFQDEIIRLVHFLEPMKNVLLLGFFNARNSCWDDEIQSNRGRGRILGIIIQDSTFNCLNDGSCTFKKDLNENEGTVLDLTFSNARLPIHWKILHIQLGRSHHKPIEITITTETLKK